MEFLLHFGDGCTQGLPVLSWNICRDHPNAGFTMPSYSIWDHSLGPTQMRVYHRCLRKRYPASKRKPMAVWRGSTTDTRFGSFNKDNYLQALRVQLHLLARNHSDVLDVKIADPLNCDDFVRSQLTDTGSRLSFEDFNTYCLIVDVDGNGWSNRFGQLVHFNTPILKMASNHTAFFEHLYAPGVAIEQFSRNLSDLPIKARRMIADCMAGGEESRGQQLANSMQATSRVLMDHVGIAEAFAYALLNYRRLSAWAVDPSLREFNPVSSSCCSYTKLPRTFAKVVEEHHFAVKEGRQKVVVAPSRKGLGV
ncbi:hypothetical protein Agub_g13492 [Astrephomene gubernaculifera]|uniref:Glycosyl transferase CAP10 domain-containing protein n=1 Tax=Astrephomene gubernaculifera TaxID=47775 RepID=A0AAD3E1G5_9CHLO|nr:hypothetical protein Agub_g13492 [Astrephomene gubernaculifera]